MHNCSNNTAQNTLWVIWINNGQQLWGWGVCKPRKLATATLTCMIVVCIWLLGNLKSTSSFPFECWKTWKQRQFCPGKSSSMPSVACSTENVSDTTVNRKLRPQYGFSHLAALGLCEVWSLLLLFYYFGFYSFKQVVERGCVAASYLLV